MKHLPIVFGLFIFLCLQGCAQYSTLTFVAKLPKKLKENSGMVANRDSTLWFVEDSGNPDDIYLVDYNGKLLRKLEVDHAKNKDWEDLASDSEGNLYIGDIGNNGNDRKNLRIYRLHDPINEKGDKINADKISFNYPDQSEFPPKDENLQFDAEAMLFHEGYLYLITKNRTSPFNGEAKIYRIQAIPGKQVAEKISGFFPCPKEKKCRITAADLSPDGTKIALLGYGELFIITEFEWPDFSKGNIRTIDLENATQLEAISFVNDSTLFLSDEVRGNGGGNLYSYSLNKLVEQKN